MATATAETSRKTGSWGRSGPPLIEVDNITKHFGSVIALGGVSLSVDRHEVHCLLGDNGAGKSTLIKTLSGVHKPSSGTFRA